MRPGHAGDVRLDAAAVAARLDVTPRHLARMVHAGRFPAPHYLGERKRWWLSEVQAWEVTATSTEPPESVRRGTGNLVNAASLPHGGAVATPAPRLCQQTLSPAHAAQERQGR